MSIHSEHAPGVPGWQLALRERCRSAGGPRLHFDAAEVEGSIAERFEKVVRAVPNRQAIVQDDYTLTYQELYHIANQLAHAILSIEPHPGETPITLFLEHGVELICAIFGALQAGRGYVVLDRQNPPARLREMLAIAESKIVITERRLLSQAQAVIGDDGKLIVYDEVVGRYPADTPKLEISPDDLAAIFFTSGTTGKPKGIVRSQRGVLGAIHYLTDTAGMSTEDRCSLLESPCFAQSLGSIFGALLYGASVSPFDPRASHLTELATRIDEHRITVLSLTPSLFRRLVREAGSHCAFPNVRLVRLNGEAVYRSDVELFRQAFSRGCILSTRWGQTETGPNTMLLIDHDAPIEEEIVPAGYAIAGKEIWIVDGAGEYVKTAHLEGEIAVRGRCLSAGYWRQEDATALKFLPDPHDDRLKICLTGDWGRLRPDGCLEVIGRMDQMVKVRGYRVELAAIEAALLANPGVAEAAVQVITGRNGDRRLAAYVVPKMASPISPSALRLALADKLPKYMIPASFTLLPALPTTASGKIDRLALPRPAAARPPLDVAFVAPRTPVEAAITGIWSTVLELEQVGIDDPFLAVGGDSLLAMQVVSQVVERLQTAVPRSRLLSAATVADMALLVTQSRADLADRQETAQLLGELESL